MHAPTPSERGFRVYTQRFQLILMSFVFVLTAMAPSLKLPPQLTPAPKDPKP